MAKVAHLHEMIDILSELVDIEGKGSFLGRIALQGLSDAEKALKSVTTAVAKFENQDFASADDTPILENKKYHNEIPLEELEKVKNEVIRRVETLYQYGSDNHIIQGIAIDCLGEAKKVLSEGMDIIDSAISETKSDITSQQLQEMASLASELDKSGDLLLMKRAALLDEILLTIGAQKTAVMAARRAQDEEISRLKALAETKEKDPYTLSKEVHDKSNNVVEAQKAIDKIKEYRPMEAPLNTRTCPDHPGAQMARIAEHTYQCSLDKSVYNYDTGYTTMKGNNVPGGNVSNQTQSLHDRPNEFTSFETRENKLNPTN